MPLRIRSPAFDHGREIPVRHTCEGEDVSPPLRWESVPANAKSLALIVDDPDAPDPKAPKTVWLHWLLYNLPPSATELPEGVRERDLPPGTLVGVNDFQRTAWGGPCPPIGRHRYFFRLLALDTVLPDLDRPRRPRVEAAMKGHVLETAELMGTYQKRK